MKKMKNKERQISQLIETIVSILLEIMSYFIDLSILDPRKVVTSPITAL